MVDNRRSFCKKFMFIVSMPLLGFAKSIKKQNVHLAMKGALDDDLFVIKASPHQTEVVDIYQMHNPRGKFLYNNLLFKSKHVPGYVNYNKKLYINDDEILLVMTANERDELYDSAFETRVLRKRTHYKSVNLLYNKKILLPALMPEYNSVKDYPLWFDVGEVGEEGNHEYNYYKLWENAIVQIGIIFKDLSKVKIQCFDKNGKRIYSYYFEPQLNATRILSFQEKKGDLNSHPFTEVGNVLNDEKDMNFPNDKYIDSMIITQGKKTYSIEMPYPFMYPNQIYVGAV